MKEEEECQRGGGGGGQKGDVWGEEVADMPHQGCRVQFKKRHDNTLVSTALMLLRGVWGGGLSPWQRSHRAKQKSFSRKDISPSSVS